MNVHHKLTLTLVLVLLNVLFADSAKLQWGYGEENGPAKWGALNPEWALCENGNVQSPIDIKTNSVQATTHALNLNYQKYSSSLVNNGHALQVDYHDGGQALLNNQSYKLQQFHIHTPSETYIDGKMYPLEIHFVHQNKQGHLLVIATLVQEGNANAALSTIASNPPKKGENRAFKDFDPSMLLPQQKAYYEFMGSLTTPPCTEDVTWIVFNTPIEASKEQIASIHNMLNNVARTVQPLNNREIRFAQ